MPRKIGWLGSLFASPFFTRLSPADQDSIVKALTLGTRTLRDFVPTILFGLN
jgi:hypothetical protein